MPKPEQKKENLSLRVDPDYSGDLVRGTVRFGRAVEQMTDQELLPLLRENPIKLVL